MRLCKDSTNLLCHGWPGGMNAWSVSCSLAQRPTAPAMNSGPLSALSTWGAPFRIKLEINGPHLPRSASPDQVLQARRSAGLGGFARAHSQPLGAPQAPERITAHNNALALGPRPEFPGEVRLRGWKDAGLDKPSVARCSKTLVVPTEAFAGQMRYGHLNEEDALAVAEALREVGATL